MRWQGKRVLLTGGTAGIGLAVAREMLTRGARPFICGRDPGRLDEALKLLPGAEGGVCDVGHIEALPGLVESAVAHLGGLDLLFNNAGVQSRVDLARIDSHAALRTIAREAIVNFVAPLQLAALALPQLRRGTEPTIVQVTSVLALVPAPQVPVYAASKAALRSACASMRGQLRRHGVRVVELVPPSVDTDLRPPRDGERRMPPTQFARAALDGIQDGAEEVRVGDARLALWLNRLAPALLHRAMARR